MIGAFLTIVCGRFVAKHQVFNLYILSVFFTTQYICPYWLKLEGTRCPLSTIIIQVMIGSRAKAATLLPTVGVTKGQTSMSYVGPRWVHVGCQRGLAFFEKGLLDGFNSQLPRQFSTNQSFITNMAERGVWSSYVFNYLLRFVPC